MKDFVLDGLAPIAARYDVILSDIWGVVHNGVGAYGPACAALEAFRARGGTVVLITNAPRPSGPVHKQLEQLGVPRSAFDAIVTSGDVALALMAEKGTQPLYHIGPKRDLALLEELRRRVPVMPPVTSLDEAAYVLCTGLTNDDPAPDDYAGRPLPEPIEAELAQMRARGLPMICANPDIIVHVGHELYYCAGALGERYIALGGETTYSGKPYGPIYREALRLAETARGAPSPRSRVLAIGDALRTDVLGAVRQDIDVLMITGGIHRDEMHGDTGRIDVEKALAFLEQTPHRPIALMDALRW